MENKQCSKNTIYTHTGILIQNVCDSGHSYNVVIQKGDLGDPWDDVSDCRPNSCQVATKNESTEAGHTF